jgi:hypothetical protein
MEDATMLDGTNEETRKYLAKRGEYIRKLVEQHDGRMYTVKEFRKLLRDSKDGI